MIYFNPPWHLQKEFSCLWMMKKKLIILKTQYKWIRLKGNIEFKNVWFAYVGEDWILKDVSFNIKKGEKMAFVGATGAGKTSIINLITRLYDIQKGEILVDGQNIKQ